jgi:hypothetical protein
VDAVTIVRIAPALYGLQHGALRNLALGYIAPDRNQQLVGERNDRDPADPPALIADAGTVKLAESRLGRSRARQVNGRDEDASRPDLCRPSLPR